MGTSTGLVGWSFTTILSVSGPSLCDCTPGFGSFSCADGVLTPELGKELLNCAAGCDWELRGRCVTFDP